MFSGLVLGNATVVEVKRSGDSSRLRVLSTFPELQGVSLGASVAVNGVCLSVVSIETLNDQSQILDFDISPETLAIANLAFLKAQDTVHLEGSLRLGDEIGGHMVSGHVDALAELVALENKDEFSLMTLQTSPNSLIDVSYFLVEKGSVALDGVSLTVNAVEDCARETKFTVMLIPHTLLKTHFRNLKVGALINIEADMMAKYIARYNQRREQLNEA